MLAPWLHSLDTEGIIHSAASLALAHLQRRQQAEQAAAQLKLGYAQLSEQQRQHDAQLGLGYAGLNQHAAAAALGSQDRNRANDRIANTAAGNLALGYAKNASGEAAAQLKDAAAKAHQASLDAYRGGLSQRAQQRIDDLRLSRADNAAMRAMEYDLKQRGYNETEAHNISTENLAQQKFLFEQSKPGNPKLSIKDDGTIKDLNAQINAFERQRLALMANPNPKNKTIDDQLMANIVQARKLKKDIFDKPEYQGKASPEAGTAPDAAKVLTSPDLSHTTFPLEEKGAFQQPQPVEDFSPEGGPHTAFPLEEAPVGYQPPQASAADALNPLQSVDYPGTPLGNSYADQTQFPAADALMGTESNPLPMGNIGIPTSDTGESGVRVMHIDTGQTGVWQGGDVPPGYQILE